MTYPGATRLRLCLAFAVIVAFAAFMPAAASADITPTASTVYGATPTANPPAGAHDDYTIVQVYDYGNGTEPQAGSEDLRKWVVDSPAGLAGNPNAIPFADRCDITAFDPAAGPGSQYANSNCPATSLVGHATVYLATDSTSGSIPAGTALTPLQGDIYIIKTSPEIPTTLATRFTSTIYQAAVCASLPGAPSAPCNVYPKTQSILAPVTSGPDGDFRVRTIPKDDNTAPVAYGPTGLGFAAGPTPAHIYRIDQHLFGTVTGQPFLTYPTRCDDWNSYSYATGTGANSNADSDPDPVAHPNEFKKSNTDAVTPDCTTKPALAASASATLSTGARDSNPQLDVSITNPTVPGGDVPKKVVTTLPPTLTTDLQGITPEKVCSIANRDAGTCQPASKVGTVKIDTPFITAGLSGDVYITQGDTAVLPNLAVYVTGAISFRLDATNKFVGPNGNQIQTTFDSLPQAPFTKFNLTINGGKDTLLTIPPCQDKTTAPQDGPITYSIDGYTGANVVTSTATNFNGCYGKPAVKKINRCVKPGKKLKVTPTGLINEPGVAKVELFTSRKSKKGFKRLTKDTVAPFKFNSKLSKKKFKKRTKYYFYAQATYKPTPDAPTGKVLKSKKATFKTCKK
jgi:hypothetical protein